MYVIRSTAVLHTACPGPHEPHMLPVTQLYHTASTGHCKALKPPTGTQVRNASMAKLVSLLHCISTVAGLKGPASA